jgi:hypothetical protein
VPCILFKVNNIKFNIEGISHCYDDSSWGKNPIHWMIRGKGNTTKQRFISNNRFERAYLRIFSTCSTDDPNYFPTSSNSLPSFLSIVRPLVFHFESINSFLLRFLPLISYLVRLGCVEDSGSREEMIYGCSRVAPTPMHGHHCFRRVQDVTPVAFPLTGTCH